MKTIVISNHKGGVGKTTLGFNLAHGLALKGKKVLVVDMDPQTNISQACNIKYSVPDMSYIKPGDIDTYKIPDYIEKETTLEQVLHEEYDEPLESCLYEVAENLAIAPGSIGLSDTSKLVSGLGPQLLKNKINELEQDLFDLVIIDCPPDLGPLTINALMACDYVLIPTQLEYWSVGGVQHLLDKLPQIKKYNKNISVLGIIPTMVRKDRVLQRSILKKLEKDCDHMVYQFHIRHIQKITNSSAASKPIWEIDKHSPGAHDFTRVVTETIERLG